MIYGAAPPVRLGFLLFCTRKVPLIDCRKLESKACCVSGMMNKIVPICGGGRAFRISFFFLSPLPGAWHRITK